MTEWRYNMTDYDILKNTKISYESILDILKNSNISEEKSDDLQKAMKTLSELYNSTYSNIVDNNKDDLITNACCKNCSNNLLVSDNIEYSYQCEECDENFYDFEAITSKSWYKKDSDEDEKLNSSFYLQLDYNNKEKNVIIGTESSSGAKYNCTTIGELISSIEEYCYDYLDYGEEYRIEYWETDWHRDAGEGMIYDKTFSNFDEAINKARELFYDKGYSSVEVLKANEESLFCCDNLSEEFYFDNDRISLVDEKIVKEYIDNWINNKEQSFNGNKLYCKDNNLFVAIDDSTGNCWVENFKNEKDAQNWLLGKDLEGEVDYEI